jgi:cell wall-associated NlpC family hydrolase
MNGSLIKVGRTVAGVGLSLALALSTTPTVALGASSAEIQAELNSASAYLQDIALQSSQKFQELENIQADLQITRDQIVDIEAQIEVKEGELAVARDVLSKSMSENYKGRVDVLSFILNSTSFDELVSHVYYANKVASYETDAIATVREIQAELDADRSALESQEAQQEDLLNQAEASYAELQELQASQQAYVNQLSVEVQEALEAERIAAEEEARRQREAAEAEAARQRAEEEAAAAQVLPTPEGDEPADNTDDGSDENIEDINTGGDSGGSDSGYDDGGSSYGGGGYSGGSTYVPDYGSGVWAAIDYAKSQLGVSYSWGGYAIANQEFDCSGLVWWAYTQAGYSIPRGQRMANGYYDSMIGWCLERGGWTTNQANLQAGDLMFWGSSVESTGHVGMCIGGGMMIHSNYDGVCIDSVYYSSGNFVGGGPIV